MEYKTCVDKISCGEHDEQYQSYLAMLGTSLSFAYLCENDSFSGCIFLFQHLIVHSVQKIFSI